MKVRSPPNPTCRVTVVRIAGSGGSVVIGFSGSRTDERRRVKHDAASPHNFLPAGRQLYLVTLSVQSDFKAAKRPLLPSQLLCRCMCVWLAGCRRHRVRTAAHTHPLTVVCKLSSLIRPLTQSSNCSFSSALPHCLCRASIHLWTAGSSWTTNSLSTQLCHWTRKRA